ncbi:hypothetical protein [Candidatus Methylobacter favarea]|nr:hypothetical protein [Candidatus Methylobacter favarea]
MMTKPAYVRWMLMQEARSLLARLGQVKPFALTESAVPAANISLSAQTAIDRYLITGRQALRLQVQAYLRWLRGLDDDNTHPAEAQHRLSLLRLRFNVTLSQFDIFADALTQRSEYETGVRLAGLDVVAADALRLEGYYAVPPVICYLDRGAGAAIRRARTRLPGGGENPVAVIRVPRERMVGSGIASSLIHEVGHQAAELLDLVNSLRQLLQLQEREAKNSIWRYWERWISEIIADFWSVARVGVASTLGLMGVVSLPRAFVFRINRNDPHPFPWIRVILSCAIGEALYPHPQWQRLARLWESFYPKTGLDAARYALLNRLEAAIPEFVDLLIHHQPRSLRGRSLIEVMDTGNRQPDRLTGYYEHWQRMPAAMYRSAPTLVFAVIGQARADGRMSPEQESTILAKLLTYWAVCDILSTAAACGKHDAAHRHQMHVHGPSGDITAMV